MSPGATQIIDLFKIFMKALHVSYYPTQRTVQTENKQNGAVRI